MSIYLEIGGKHKKMIEITLKTFGGVSAAHKLDLPYDSPCQRLHGHFWNIRIEITIDINQVNQKTGMILDFGKVKETFNRYDHQYLNQFFEQPTAENISIKILKLLKELLIREKIIYKKILVEVKETENNIIEVVDIPK